MANFIYATDGEGLYTISLDDFSYASVGDHGVSDIRGLARSPGAAGGYAFRPIGGALYSINLSTGVCTLIGSDSGPLGGAALCVDATDETIYLLDDYSELWSLDPDTGAATDLGLPAPNCFYALASKAADPGYLYSIEHVVGDVYRVSRIDLSNLSVSAWSSIGFIIPADLVWHGDGTLYGICNHATDGTALTTWTAGFPPGSPGDPGKWFWDACPGEYSVGEMDRVHLCHDKAGILYRATVEASAVKVWRSTDAGASWAGPWTVSAGSRPTVVSLPSGRLLCGYASGGNCLIRASDNRGETWGASFGSQAGSQPYMWIDPKGYILHRAYWSGGQIKHQASFDEGVTWATATNVKAEATEVAPEGVCLADGRPLAAWYASAAWTQRKNPRLDGGGAWA